MADFSGWFQQRLILAADFSGWFQGLIQRQPYFLGRPARTCPQLSQPPNWNFRIQTHPPLPSENLCKGEMTLKCVQRPQGQFGSRAAFAHAALVNFLFPAPGKLGRFSAGNSSIIKILTGVCRPRASPSGYFTRFFRWEAVLSSIIKHIRNAKAKNDYSSQKILKIFIFS